MENEKLEPIGEIKLAPQKRYEECEWCYQFDDDEPKIFAWTNGDMTDEDPAVTFTVSNTEGAYVSFTQNGKTFKLFARELTAEGRELRDYQNVTAERLKRDLENASQNKEA